MGVRRKYKKKPTSFVTAVQLDLDTEGFVYNKWGSKQVCKRGDWLVDNNGDTYTVDREIFERTYRELSPGVHLKMTPIWAELAAAPGTVDTKEGRSQYEAGDYLVANNEDGTDAYCIDAEKFNSMYELDE